MKKPINQFTDSELKELIKHHRLFGVGKPFNASPKEISNLKLILLAGLGIFLLIIYLMIGFPVG